MLAYIFLIGGALMLLYNFYQAWMLFPDFRNWRFLYVMAATAIITYPFWYIWIFIWIGRWIYQRRQA